MRYLFVSSNIPNDSKKALWSLGFRPFFILGSTSAVILIALWISHLAGVYSNLPYANGTLWHAHEMLFGFVGAILAGFLLTASQNWSGIPGIRGTPLKGLVVFWLCGRLFPFLGFPSAFSAMVDVVFFPLIAWAISPQLMQSKQKHNRIFFLFLGLLSLANILTQLGLTELHPGMAAYGTRLGISMILLIIILITGRIIPFFNGRVIENTKLKKYPLLEKVTFVITGLFFIGYIFNINPNVLSIIAIPAFLTHSLRWLFWRPDQTLKTPILAVLYMGYIWLIVGFFLAAMHLFYPVLPGLHLHAWTAGAMGVLIYGMVTRVSLGHTGRAIQASPLIVLGYFIINLGVLFRVILPLFFSEIYSTLITISGSLWLMAFVILLWEFIPILIQPRPDGKEG